jgi:hypothetical protein
MTIAVVAAASDEALTLHASHLGGSEQAANGLPPLLLLLLPVTPWVRCCCQSQLQLRCWLQPRCLCCCLQLHCLRPLLVLLQLHRGAPAASAGTSLLLISRTLNSGHLPQ